MSTKPWFRIVVENPRTVLFGGFVTYLVGGLLLPKGLKRRAYFRPITSTLGSLLGIIGFITYSVRDIQDAIEDGRTKVWRQALDALKLFLHESGLEDEFSTTLGSDHLFPSLMVLTDLQNQIQRDRRKRLVLEGAPRISEEELKIGRHYMHYATAVYGPQMIAAADLAVVGDVQGSSSDTNNTIIARHCELNLAEEDKKWEMWCDYDTDFTDATNNHAQCCLIVCDHEKKEVILSIRGTFSLSGIITDLAAHASSFCEGEAHSGMAEAAIATWDTVWKRILEQKMKDMPKDYKFIITGHSLGGGVACLLTILVYHRLEQYGSLQGRKIQCYAIAPPPVFAPLSAASNAVDNTIAYVHNWDIVPSLSVDAIRRLMACIDRIESVFQEHPLWEMAVKRFELGEPAADLIDAYAPKTKLRVLKGAPILVVPARQLVWMEKDPTCEVEDKYVAHILDPTLYAERVLDLELPDCVRDHMSDQYEAAFDGLLRKDA